MFGDVFLAKAPGLVAGDDNHLVYVKSLLAREENVQIEFRAEVEMFHKLHHNRICQLLALCKEIEPIYAVMEYCEWVCRSYITQDGRYEACIHFGDVILQGDLKQFLIATSGSKSQQLTIEPPNEAQKITMCYQVANTIDTMIIQCHPVY